MVRLKWNHDSEHCYKVFYCFFLSSALYVNNSFIVCCFVQEECERRVWGRSWWPPPWWQVHESSFFFLSYNNVQNFGSIWVSPSKTCNQKLNFLLQVFLGHFQFFRWSSDTIIYSIKLHFYFKLSHWQEIW